MSESKRIYLSPPHMSGHEQKYIQSAFEANWIAPLGPNVDGFEQAIVDYTNCGHCAALSSGTAALHLALILLNVGKGDEVICSSFTFSASANPIKYQGATPIFVDSEMSTWNMDPELLREAIISRRDVTGKMPKAIVLVHLYGMPAKMEEICAIAEEFDIPLIEDAAEALGSTFKEQKLGTFGTFGIYSFNGNKILSTSGGGVLVSKSEEQIKKARFLATQARDVAPHYQHSEVGYNYRMSNILAGIGRGQMETLDRWVEKRRAIHVWYKELFSEIDGVTVLIEPNSNYYSNHWLTCIFIDKVKASFTANDLIKVFAIADIESRPLWKPMHLQPVFEEEPAYVNGNAEELFKNGVCLPSGSSLTEADKGRINDAIFTLVDRR